MVCFCNVLFWYYCRLFKRKYCLLDNFAFSFIYLFYFVDTDFHQKD